MTQESEALIGELGKALGIEGLAFDAEGVCDLVFDEAITVRLAQDAAADRVLAVSAVGRIGDDGGEAMLENLLAANLFWSGTGGATIAAEPDGTLALMQAWPLAGLGFPQFEEGLRGFVEACEAWTRRLQGAEAPAPVAPSNAPPAPDIPSIPFGIRV